MFVPDHDLKNRAIAEAISQSQPAPASLATQPTATPAKGRGENRRANRAVTQAHHQSAKAQVEAWTTRPAPTRSPRSRKPLPIGPVAQGDFSRIDPNYPQISPTDHRMRPTVDAGAATGYRGAGRSRHSGFATGRDNHCLVDSGTLPHGIVKPPLLVAYACTPAGSPRSPVFRRAPDYAISNGQTRCPIQGDRNYTDLDLTEVEAPIHDAGFQLIKDLKNHQRNQTGPTRKALYRDGFFSPRAPPSRC